MYNRYVRNDSGIYERITVSEEHAPHPTKDQIKPTPNVTASRPNTTSPFGKGGLLSGILDKLKLSEVDTGDLLLLVLLFLLFQDGEDDELLIALGLLLIL